MANRSILTVLWTPIRLNFKGSVIITCFDIPIVPPDVVSDKRRFGHLEKLWAYLNIQQLLDKYELNKNENSTAKAKALELALKYSFVTPLTSLVVVKPNDTTSSVALEKIKPLNYRYNFGSSAGSMMSANSFALHPAPLHTSAFPLKGRWNHMNYRRMYSSAYNYVENEDEYGDISESFWKKLDQIMTTSAADSAQVLTDKLNATSLHDIEELPWLSDSITLNATNTVYQVSLNTSGQSYQNCTTPDQVHGNCEHLKDCIVSSILKSFDTFLSLFCPIESFYAGICCLV